MEFSSNDLKVTGLLSTSCMLLEMASCLVWPTTFTFRPISMPPSCNPTLCTALTTHLSPTIPINQNFHGPPVTPSNTYHHCIHLPILALPVLHSKQQESMHHTSHIVQFCAMLEPWQHPLYGPICKLQPTNWLLHVCQDGSTHLLVSNASVQKNKQSRFACVINHDNTMLWKGVGLALGSADDMYSGRAEAFGILTGLLFL